MPFKSQRQREFMWARYPEMAKRWEAHTPDKKLPEKVSNGKTPRQDTKGS